MFAKPYFLHLKYVFESVLRRQRRILLFFAAVFSLQPLFAQMSEVLNAKVRSVQVRANGRSGLPVIRLGSDDVLSVDFDELSHDYLRLAYRILPLNLDLSPNTNLLESEYLQSVDDYVLIDEAELSMTTSVLYTHYHFLLPNEALCPIISGNYAVEVFDKEAEDERVLFRSTFFVVDEKVSVNLVVSGDTEIDRYDANQQLHVDVSSIDNLSSRDAAEEVKLVVVQNRDWKRAVVSPKPTGWAASALHWHNSRELIFRGGNEFRKFEFMSTRYPGLHFDGIRYYEPYYHATLQTDEVSRNYLYTEDQDGTFVLRSETDTPETDADYAWVHFSLHAPRQPQNVYVVGDFSNYHLADEYRLRYDGASETYTASVLLKTGYYNYRYVLSDGTIAPLEGNFWQTENEYTVLVYYTPKGGRYDQLVGHRVGTWKPQ